MNQCPGRYCGRLPVDENSTNVSTCGACPRGTRSNDINVCQTCDLSLALYDWLYLGFMAMLPLLLNCFFIEFSAQRKATRKLLTFEHLCALFECVASSVISILLCDPKGTMYLSFCGVTELSDWYTMFYNPSVDYTIRLHCTQEAVYPLYSLPFMYYTCCLIVMTLIRSLFILWPMKTRKTGVSGSIYAALYFYPMLIIVHAMCAGLLYYSFPYLLLVATLIANALHLAVYENQTPKGLLCDIVKKPQNLISLSVFVALYAYCTISITRFSEPVADGCILLLTPLPTLFYILTVRVSEPTKLLKVP